MEKFEEKNVETNETSNNINNSEASNIKIVENISNEQNESYKINNDDLILNSNKKEINGKNLLPLNNIANLNLNNLNLNNYSIDSINEEEIDNNHKLYKDVMKGNNMNFNESGNGSNIIFNGNQNNVNNQDLLGNFDYNMEFEKNLEINGDKETDQIFNETLNDFGKDLTINISNIIQKYVNDDMLTYDFNKIRDSIVKDLKNKNISANLIEKAINKIPDIYFLFLSNKLN